MITQMTGAIINIIFDPIFIFGLNMGVTGAALATVLGQLVATALGFYINHRYNKEITLKLKGFKPDMKAIKRIYSVGFPSIVMQSVSSVMTFGMNNILLAFSSTATAVFGVYFKLQSFILMPVLGLNNGMVPILSYNYCARNKERIMQAIKLSMAAALCIMAIGIFIFQVFPEQLLLMFDASETMIEIGVPALKIISTHFILAGFCIIMTASFQAFGKGHYSLINSLMRQLVVLLPSAYILAQTGKLDNVWWSFPIAELMSLTVSSFFMVKIYKNIIKNI
jgi:Na+-driven multidrug efflux pump